MKVRLATPEDDAALRALTLATPMPGRVALALVHGYEPDVQTVVAEKGGELIACGRRQVRERYINGELRPTAYLSGLRGTDGWAIVRGYELLRELHEADGRPPTFTSVMADNAAALRFFRGRRGLPCYEEIGRYVTCVIPTSKVARLPSITHESSAHFSSPATSADLVRDSAYLTVVTRYRGIYRLIRPLLPSLGKPLRIGCVTPAGMGQWAAVADEAQRREWSHVVVGSDGLHGRRLHSHLFAVRWPGDDWVLDDRPVWPEVGDL